MYYKFKNLQTVSTLSSSLSNSIIHLFIVAAIIAGGFAHYTDASAQISRIDRTTSPLKCKSTKADTTCYDDHSDLVITVPGKHGPVQIDKRKVHQSEIKIDPKEDLPAKTQIVGYIVKSVEKDQVISNLSNAQLRITYTRSGFTPVFWHTNQWAFPTYDRSNTGGPEMAGNCC